MSNEYSENIPLSRDRHGRVSAEWPDGARGCVISRELLDQMIEEANARCWIPVCDLLPEFVDSLPNGERFSRPVLVALEATGDVMTGTYGDQMGWIVGSDCMNTTITHWMPLPEPPKCATH